MTTEAAHKASQVIIEHFGDEPIDLAVILGSGLGAITQQLSQAKHLDYHAIEGFPKVSVAGHHGRLSVGYIGRSRVLCMSGRVHCYESTNAAATIRTYIQTLKLIGVQRLLLTNAAGSLRKEIGPGELMLITDHLNFQFTNPLIGQTDNEFGSRFVPLDNAYNPEMNLGLLKSAEEMGVELHQGVYVAVLGPPYETAAEIRAFSMLGADLVGMSTVPEVIAARQCNLTVAAVSTITNYATGLANTAHNHDEVIANAAKAGERLQRLIHHFAQKL